MSNYVSGLVWKANFPSVAAKLIALKLADNANDEGGDVFPATTTIERLTGVARSTVHNWLRIFHECGLVEIEHQSKGGARGSVATSTRRRFNMGLLVAIADTFDSRRRTGSLPTHQFVETGRKCWAIEPIGVTVPPASNDQSDEVTRPFSGPVRQTDPSAQRTRPVRPADTTRPPSGPKPTLNHPENLHPLTPASGGTGSDGLDDEGEARHGIVSSPTEKQAAWIAALRADGVAMSVVERLLVPLLTSKRFSSATPLEDLRAARDATRHLGPELLDKALGLIRDSGVGTVKADRLRSAIDAVERGGAMAVIERGTPAWDAWMAHYQALEPKAASLMDRYERWQVPAAWPPRTSGCEAA